MPCILATSVTDVFSFDDLPLPGEKRLAVKVTPAAERELRKRHPWLYDGGITSDVSGGSPGDLAVIFDKKRDFLAIGLFDPDSPIAVRVLHHGKPTTIDAAWWRSTIDAALERRRPLITSSGETTTTGYRVINGENDAMPGFIADRYDHVIVVKLYSQAWLPHLRDVIPALVAACETADTEAETAGAPAAARPIDTVVFRLARSLQRGSTFGLSDGLVVDAATLQPRTLIEPVVFHENGLMFEAYPIAGQKTGHFLDQRDNRQRVRDRASGARVLDVFACTGGFSVYAAAGGAASVHSIDLAPEAIETAKRNMALNPETAGTTFRTSVVDAFEAMAAMADRGEQYDIVIVDPPSFAHKQGDVPRARSAYRRLTKLALQLVAPGGLLVQASCSSRIPAAEFFDLVLDAAADDGVGLEDVLETGHAIDHPATFFEGYYLKAMFARRS